MMLKNVIVLLGLIACSSTVVADDFSYSCKVGKQTYPLKVYGDRHELTWRGETYQTTELQAGDQQDCPRFGWRASKLGSTFDFCTATKGVADFTERGGANVSCKQIVGGALEATSPNSAMPVVIAMAKQVVTHGNQGESAKFDRKYLSADLVRFNAHVGDAQARDFDADFLTGTQDYSDFVFESATEDLIGADKSWGRGTVNVTYRASNGYHHILHYVMIKEDGGWKVDDIIYNKPLESYRNIITRSVKN